MRGDALQRTGRRQTAAAAGLAHSCAYGALRTFGAEIGLAFQIQDDILDVTGETSVIGRKNGADAALGKPTYPSVFGLEAARYIAMQHRNRALTAAEGLGAAAVQLRQLAYYVVDRAL